MRNNAWKKPNNPVFPFQKTSLQRANIITDAHMQGPSTHAEPHFIKINYLLGGFLQNHVLQHKRSFRHKGGKITTSMF